jgi:murein DD-endopeptidase MepM/ murein hydrolase activator NlpD
MARIIPVTPDVPAPPVLPVTPANPAPGTLGAPTGTIPTTLKIAYGRGLAWATVNRWDREFLTSGAKHDVLPQMLKAMAVIESGGQMIYNGSGSGAYGIMQIKPQFWGAEARRLGYDLMTPAGNIGFAAAMLGGDARGVKGSTPEERFLYSYYPVYGPDGKLCLDCKGEDGGTPRQYLSDMHELMRLIDLAAGAINPVPTPTPEKDLLKLIFGGKYTISQEWAVTSSAADYSYAIGHGLNGRQHTGIDAVGNLRDPLYAPFAGTVVCASTGWGGGAWNTGCAAFNDYSDGGGAGRIELLHPDGKRSLILGHSDTTVVKPGAQVRQGEKVGTVGSMNGPHCHIEAREYNASATYILRDPRKLFADITGTVSEQYVERIPLPQPEEFARDWEVEVIRDGVPVRQYGSVQAPRVAPDLMKGETFKAVAMIPGLEGTPYWVSRAAGRVPIEGTEGKVKEAPE